jgi:hypothetical protein
VCAPLPGTSGIPSLLPIPSRRFPTRDGAQRGDTPLKQVSELLLLLRCQASQHLGLDLTDGDVAGPVRKIDTPKFISDFAPFSG